MHTSFFLASLAKKMNEARDFVEEDEEGEENGREADSHPDAEEQVSQRRPVILLSRTKLAKMTRNMKRVQMRRTRGRIS